MVLCGNCRKNVKPEMYLTWKGFIYGLGIFYLIDIITTIPHCPNCNFPMPRRNMVFVIHLPQYPVKLAKMSLLQLVHFRDRVISAYRKSYLNRKFDPSHSTLGSGHSAHASCCPHSQVRTFAPAPLSPDFCQGTGTRTRDRS